MNIFYEFITVSNFIHTVHRMNLLNEDRNKTNSFSKAAQNIIYYEITLQELLLEKTADAHTFFLKSSRILRQSSDQKS